MQITKLNWLIYFIITFFSYALSATITYAESDSPNIFYIDKLKSESSESSKTKLERRAAPPLKKSLASIQDGLIASYDLTQNANDSTGITGSMLLSNTHFNDNSLYLNGLYHIDENTGYYASTPFLNINTFDPTTTTNHFDLTFSLKFFPIAFGKNNDITYPKYRNTIIMGGRSYRWLSIRKGHDTNSLEVMFNNSKETYTFDNLSLDEKKWHTLSFSFSLQQKTFLLALNGTLIGEKRLPSDFDLEFLGLGSSVVESESTLLFTDYATGGVFYGNIKDLIIFNKFHHASELISLNADTSDTTTKTVSYTDTFNLKIDQPLAVDASVDYQTRDGTAKAGTDYIATSGTATIPAGQTSVDIGVDILIANTDKTFSLVITNPKGAEFPAGMTEIVVSHTIKEQGTNNNDVDADILQGRFIDSPVAGLQYQTQTLSGVTTADGTFQYRVGEEINFSIGGIQLGSTIGDDIITPLNLSTGAIAVNETQVNNRVRLLMGLDEDNDATNGIVISTQIRQKLANKTLDFSVSGNEFTGSADALIKEVKGNSASITTIESAQTHFEQSLTDLGIPTDCGGVPVPLYGSDHENAFLIQNANCEQRKRLQTFLEFLVPQHRNEHNFLSDHINGVFDETEHARAILKDRARITNWILAKHANDIYVSEILNFASQNVSAISGNSQYSEALWTLLYGGIEIVNGQIAVASGAIATVTYAAEKLNDMALMLGAIYFTNDALEDKYNLIIADEILTAYYRNGAKWDNNLAAAFNLSQPDLFGIMESARKKISITKDDYNSVDVLNILKTSIRAVEAMQGNRFPLSDFCEKMHPEFCPKITEQDLGTATEGGLFNVATSGLKAIDGLKPYTWNRLGTSSDCQFENNQSLFINPNSFLDISLPIPKIANDCTVTVDVELTDANGKKDRKNLLFNIKKSAKVDSDNDGMPDQWETDHGLNPNDPSDANQDPDKDNLTNKQEYEAGSNPRSFDGLVAAPQNLQATAGDQQITFTWDALANADSYTLYLAEEPNFTPDNYAAHNGGQMFLNVSSPYTLTGLSTGKTYYAIVTATLNGVESAASSPISVTLPNPSALDEIALVSVSSAGVQGNSRSDDSSISADGRYIAFESWANNLVDNETNSAKDIFVHDRQTGQTARVSVSSTGEQGNGDSYRPSISADGQYITFWSWATNLVDNDTNGAKDIFVHDRQTGQTTRVSVSSTGAQGNHTSDNPRISADGRYIAFRSWATNLVDNDSNYEWDIFVHDRTTGQTTRVSVSSSGEQGNASSEELSISADGRYITFWSRARNLVENDSNGDSDIFVHDRTTGQTTRVSVSNTGEQGNEWSYDPSISADGRYIAFQSFANNLVDNDTNGIDDIFVHDRETGQTTRVSVSNTGEQVHGRSYDPSISAEGRYIAFHSEATNLVDNDTNGIDDIFVHDRETGQTARISVSSAGEEGNHHSNDPIISADGHYITFASQATNFIENDVNGLGMDIFVAPNPLFNTN